MVDVINTVNYVVQRSPKSNKQVVHVDKLKKCFSETRTPWTALPCEGDAETEVDRRDEPIETVPLVDSIPTDVDLVAPSPVEYVPEAPVLVEPDAVVTTLEESQGGRFLRRRECLQPPRRYR